MHTGSDDPPSHPTHLTQLPVINHPRLDTNQRSSTNVDSQRHSTTALVLPDTCTANSIVPRGTLTDPATGFLEPSQVA